MNRPEPVYRSLMEKRGLERRAALAEAKLVACDLCAWECRVDRKAGKLGVCRTDDRARVSSYGPHRGEEAPLSGWLGSGTVFFTRCNLRCQYCQNYDISQSDAGDLVDAPRLAAIFLELQEQGCHNINLVSPTHVVPQILAALSIAAPAGLKLPLVYNTGGYDSLGALELLDGVIDIYMPDMKYSSPQAGLHYSKVRTYPAVNQAAVLAMFRQVGTLQIDDRGLAFRGLLVRHLVLPFNLAGTAEIVRFLSGQVSPDTCLNLMDQYRPAFNARQFPKLKRAITRQEYRSAIELARAAGLKRLILNE